MAFRFNPFTGTLDLDPAPELSKRLNQFRDSRRIYVSPEGNDSNNGTSPGEPLRTLAAAAAAAMPGDLIEVGPGTYEETALPIRWKRNVGILGKGLRNVLVRPAAGREYNDIFHVDSGFWCWGLKFAGHQSNALLGQQSWAISFDALADNRDIGAVGLGAFILKSPYIQNCSSITAEDDEGLAGSISTGDTGGGILVDGSRCAINSPIRSMVVDSYTQVNLGGPGALVCNDGYGQFVSFFGTFCEYHVKTASGGQVNLSGGGTSDFGTYGLIADGYSPSPVFTGKVRAAGFGAPRIEKAVTIDTSTDVFTSIGHGLAVNDQVQFKASNGLLPTGLNPSTTYYVISAGLTQDAFRVSATQGGSALAMTGSADGTYQVVRQGVTQIDVIGFSANRLGRQVKYPTPGSLGSQANPVVIAGINGNTFNVTLGTSSILHQYTGGGTLRVGSNTYPITSCVYDGATGNTTLSADGYTPVLSASVSLEGLSFICNSSSRPNPSQLMFPQLVFPRNASTGAAEAKSFTYTRTGVNTLTFAETPALNGPDHEYVSGGTAVVGGTDLGVAGAAYNKATGVVTLTTKSPVPAASGTVTVDGLAFICPTSAYVVTSSVPIDANGTEVANNDVARAGYRVLFYSATNGGLLNPLAANQVLDFRIRSQITAPGHTFEYVGSGTNYEALPTNGGVPVPANKIVELNNGRIYSSNTDELGNFAVGDQFSVDGTTGAVTINTSQFNLSGLNFIGPFSRNGGISTVGVQLREISNNANLLASTGAADGNTAATQFAVKSYVDNRFLTNVTKATGQPLTIIDTSSQDGNGFWTRSREIELSLNQANGLLQLNGSGLVPAALLPSFVDDIVEVANFAALPAEGESGKIYITLNDGKRFRWGGTTYVEIIDTGTDLGYTASTRLLTSSTGAGVTLPEATTSVPGLMAAADKTKLDGVATGATANATDSQLRDRSTHTGTQAASTITGLSTVATSGAYADLTGRPALGTAAALDVPLAGNAASGQIVKGDDSRLADARTPLPHTQTASTISDSTVPGRALLTAASAAAQRASLGLAAVASTGAYADLSGTPTLGTAAALNAGTGANNVVQLDGSGRLPAIDGSQLTNLPSGGGGGGVTNVTGTAPIVSTGGSTPVISINLATSSTAGSMSAADKQKLDGIAASATNTPLSNATPSALGIAAAGTSSSAARSDHVHAQPTAAGIGAVPAGAITTSGLTMATGRLLGRSTASAGPVEELVIGPGLSLSGGTLSSEVADGDKGDISITGGVWSIDFGAVTYGKIQNVTATDRILGRSSAGAGSVEEITCTAAGRALLDDADAAAQRATLGLGTLATQNGTFSGTSSGTNTGDQTIALTGDVTGSGTGTFAATLSNTGVSAGTYNDSATAVRPFTVDTKGRITAIGAAVTVTPAFSSITSRPTTLSGYGITDAATSTHAHGNLTNAGAIGSTANLPIITGASGVLQAGSFGTAANTFCQGNDSRLSDTRTPTDGSVTNVKVASNAAIAFSKLANVSATDRLLGRSSAGAGPIEEITCTAAGRALISGADAAAQRTTLGLASASTPQFAGLGLNVAPVSGIALAVGGATVALRTTVTAVSSVYTLDIRTSNEFVTAAAINGNVAINLDGLGALPSGYLWRGVLKFAYTSGTIAWFSGNTGYTVKWDGGTAMTPTAGEHEKVIIEVVGGDTTIEVAAMLGRT